MDRLRLGDEIRSNNDPRGLAPCPIRAGERRSDDTRAWR